MHAFEGILVNFCSVNKFPSRFVVIASFDRQSRSPTALMELFSCSCSSEPGDIYSYKRGIFRKLDFNGLFKQCVGIDHYFLRQPFKVCVFSLFRRHGLSGPSSIWVESASFHGSIGLLRCDTCDHAAAISVQRHPHVQYIPADQSPCSVKDW